METYKGKIDKAKTANWLEKKKYNGTVKDFEVLDTLQRDGNLILELIPTDSDNAEGEFLQVGGKLQNALIERLGDDTTNWEGEIIELKFEKYIPPKGREKEVSPGTTVSLIETKTEEVK